jgi:hypothetical protein
MQGRIGESRRIAPDPAAFAYALIRACGSFTTAEKA